MTEDIIALLIALVTAIATPLATVYSVKKQNSVMTAERNAKLDADLSGIHQSIERLEKKQDKHNQVIERIYAVEGSIGVLEERVNNLERKGKNG